MHEHESDESARGPRRRDFLAKGGALAVGATAATAGAVALTANPAAAATNAPLYLPFGPERVFDTRLSSGGPGPLPSGQFDTLSGIDAAFLAANFNLTIVNTFGSGFLSVWPGPDTNPNNGNSSINWFGSNFILANTAFTGIGAGGSVNIGCGGGGQTDYILDVTAVVEVTDLSTFTSVRDAASAVFAELSHVRH